MTLTLVTTVTDMICVFFRVRLRFRNFHDRWCCSTCGRLLISLRPSSRIMLASKGFNFRLHCLYSSSHLLHKRCRVLFHPYGFNRVSLKILGPTVGAKMFLLEWDEENSCCFCSGMLRLHRLVLRPPVLPLGSSFLNIKMGVTCKKHSDAQVRIYLHRDRFLAAHSFCRNILPANNVLPACLGNKVNSPPVTQKLDQSATIPNSFTEQSNILETCLEQDENSLSDDITNSYSLSRDDIFEKNMHNGVSDAINFMETNILIAFNATFVDDKINFLPLVRKINQSTPVPNNLTGQPDKLDVCPEQGKISHSQKQNEEFLEKNIHSGTTKAFNSMEMDISTNATNVGLVLFETKAFDSESNLSISSSILNPLKSHENCIVE
ncbi:uncharacterized protein LOC124845913 [Vigna umbellata]|uniref:uncharacterized protein LOC124845913 n=1 Tax=Vigna umbellata TaxID=87088 RepID=UPI001F5F815F|nr:uncharacterized protein LOC124845913 [Vigna umbellata]